MFSRLKISVATAAVKRFLGPVPGSIVKHLNAGEIARIAATAAVTGGVSTVVPALVASIGLVVAPQDVALATAAVTVISETYRRLGHGSPAAVAGP